MAQWFLLVASLLRNQIRHKKLGYGSENLFSVQNLTRCSLYRKTMTIFVGKNMLELYKLPYGSLLFSSVVTDNYGG